MVDWCPVNQKNRTTTSIWKCFCQSTNPTFPQGCWSLHQLLKSKGRVQIEQVASSLQDHIKKKDTNKFNDSHTHRVATMLPVHVFGLWEEARGPGKNSHRCNIQTLHRKARGLGFEPSTVDKTQHQFSLYTLQFCIIVCFFFQF